MKVFVHIKLWTVENVYTIQLYIRYVVYVDSPLEMDLLVLEHQMY